MSDDRMNQLVQSIEINISNLLRWAAFEPNDEATWKRVRQIAIDFLSTQWRNGAFVGNTPERAFFVRCDRSTMTEDDIRAGRLICLIGIAPAKPSEFVVLRIIQMTKSSG